MWYDSPKKKRSDDTLEVWEWEDEEAKEAGVVEPKKPSALTWWNVQIGFNGGEKSLEFNFSDVENPDAELLAKQLAREVMGFGQGVWESADQLTRINRAHITFVRVTSRTRFLDN